MTKRNYNRIPTQLTENQFDQFIFPYLIIPKKGPKPKITYFKRFNYTLKVLITGSQWKELVIEKDGMA